MGKNLLSPWAWVTLFFLLVTPNQIEGQRGNLDIIEKEIFEDYDLDHIDNHHKYNGAQRQWELIENIPLNMYNQYKGNLAEDASNGLPRILLRDFAGNKKKDSSLENAYGIYLPSIDEGIVDNALCINDTLKIARVFDEPFLMKILNLIMHKWPQKILDSWGKPGDGILHGDTTIWGFLEECTDIHVKEHLFKKKIPFFPDEYIAEFRGKYCLVHVKLLNFTGPYDFPPEVTLEERALIEIATSPESYYYGTCMPDSCDDEDLRASIEQRINNTNVELVDVQCQTEDGIGGEKTSGDIAFEVIVGCLWCIMVTAAMVEFLIDLAKKPKLKEGPLKFWLAFSSYRSMSKVFRIVNKTNPDVIDCLHGMRALSMIWVTWCHSYSLLTKATQNMKGLELITTRVADQIIFNGSFSVDTFFFMSGLLAAYSVLREKEITGKVNWIMYYVHRIVRLVPAIALTCFFLATVARYALVGPYGPYVNKEFLQPCRDYWYMDVLLASNYPNEGYKCLPQSWYTAVDSQLYLILPLILVPILMSPKIGGAVLSLFTIASFIVPTALFAAYDLKPYLPFVVPEVQPQEMTLNNDEMPWSRASPYFMGVWAGWILFTCKEKKIKMPLWFVALGWCLSAAVSCTILLGMAPYNYAYNPPVLPSSLSTFYGGFSRGAWGLSLVWVVFACQKGYGGPINTFLGHSCFLPISRLSYSMFLITVPVQFLSAGSTFIPLYMNHSYKFIETCGYLFVGGLMGLGVAMTVEIPFLSLLKLIAPRPGRNVLEEPLKEN